MSTSFLQALPPSILADLNDSQQMMVVNILEKLMERDPQISRLKQLPPDLILNDNGEVMFKTTNRGNTSSNGIDSVFTMIGDVIDTSVRAMKPSWALQEDGSYRLRYVKHTVDKALSLPCVSFQVISTEPGAFGAGKEGSPTARIRKPFFRQAYPDPKNIDSEVLIFSMRYDSEIELLVQASTSEEVDIIRSWLEDIITHNIWYFINSGVQNFLFQKRSADYTKDIDNTNVYCRPLRYFLMTEKLSWYSLFTLKELVLNLEIKP